MPQFSLQASLLLCSVIPTENALRGEKWGKWAIGFWPLTNSFLLFGFQTTVQSFIKIELVVGEVTNRQTDTSDFIICSMLRSLRVFEMAIVRKIRGCSRRDHRRNTDMMKDLALDKDIVEVVRTRRLLYFGHAVRIDSQIDIPTCYFTGTYMATVREEGQKRDGWTMQQKIVKHYVCLFLMLTVSPMTESVGEPWSTIAKVELPERADSSTSPRHCQIKSSPCYEDKKYK